jgi:hypothetical protein
MRGQNRKVMKNKRKNKFMRNSIYFHRSLAIRVEKKQNTRNLLSHALAFLLSSKSQIHHRQWHSGRSSLSLFHVSCSLSLSTRKLQLHTVIRFFLNKSFIKFQSTWRAQWWKMQTSKMINWRTWTPMKSSELLVFSTTRFVSSRFNFSSLFSIIFFFNFLVV